MKRNNNLTISYVKLRQLIGVLGLIFPAVCFLAGFIFANLPLQRSISIYYHSNVRDIFTGFLVCVSAFLITYKGYLPVDNIVTSLCGSSCLGVAVFPCKGQYIWPRLTGIFLMDPAVSNKLHLICAGTFFFLLAVNAFFLFTKTDKKSAMTREKKKRNIVYRICGLAIFISLAALGILYVVFSEKDEVLIKYHITFWLETIMLIAFGASWLIKGETLLKDRLGQEKNKRRSKLMRRYAPFRR